MRFAPAAAALSLLVAVSASMGQGAEPVADPRAAALIAEGNTAVEAGNLQGAIDAYEAALVVDPAYTPILLDLAEVARQQGLQGKAIRFYREALDRDPDNYAAISGEGEALVEKGAVAKAKENLAKLQSMCGENCAETRELAAAITQGPEERVFAAELVLPDTQVTQN